MTDPRPRFRLVPSEIYSAKRASLRPDRRMRIEWAEEEIAEDPLHVHWRRHRADGPIVDYSAADTGLVIEYEVLDGELVALVDLIDLKKLRPLERRG